MSLLNLLDNALDRTVIGGYDRLGYHARKPLWNDADLDTNLAGRTAVVTGANSGLGRVTARELLRRGARVAMVCRDGRRGETARVEILREINRATAGTATVLVADMGELSQIRALADRLRNEFGHVHILVNNAGALLNQRQDTAAGIERTFATNVLGYFTLTELLFETLRDSAPSRLINVSSGGMYPVRLCPDDLEWRSRPYDGVRAYAESKRAEIILTEIWARRLRGTGVFTASMHPGWADTPGVQNALPVFRALTRFILRSPEEGADTILWLALRPNLADADGGLFWFDRRARPTHRFAHTKHTPAELKQFWDYCRERTRTGPALDLDFFRGLEACSE